jgi:hypothetical protein
MPVSAGQLASVKKRRQLAQGNVSVYSLAADGAAHAAATASDAATAHAQQAQAPSNPKKRKDKYDFNMRRRAMDSLPARPAHAERSAGRPTIEPDFSAVQMASAVEIATTPKPKGRRPKPGGKFPCPRCGETFQQLVSL